jgi:carbon-monoxide dehydrogenase large subunit
MNRRIRFVGERVKIIEGPLLVTGKGKFTEDLNFPNTLHIAFLRSPFAHARVKRIDVSDALKIKGVVSALSGKDLGYECYSPQLKDAKTYKRYALAKNKVIYAGEPVAAVVAEDRYTAEDALELIQVEYEPLPVFLDAEEALESPPIHEDMPDNIYYHYSFQSGDVEKAFKSADKILKEKFENSSYTGAPIECRSCVAMYNHYTSELKVWVPNQLIHVLRTLLSHWLGLPENKISIYSQHIGGAFGTKCGGFPEEVVTCAGAMMVNRPVKWSESRRENLTSSVQVHEITHNIEVAFNNDGTILGLKDRIVANIGAYATVGNYEPVTHSWTYMSGCYKIPNIKADVYCVATNKGPFGAVRGFGRIMGAFTIERIMNLIARELGIDPVVVRLRNMLTSESFPYKSPTGMYYDKNSFVEIFQLALEKFDYYKWRETQKRLRNEGKRIGIGISHSFGPSGLDASKTQGIPGWELIRMRMTPTGRVTIFTALCPHGQSHVTILSQIAADELGISMDDITVIHGDTDSTPYGVGTWADRSATAGGAAVIDAAKRLKKKIAMIAAYNLGTTPDKIKVEDGKAFVADEPSKQLSYADIAHIAYYRSDLMPAELEPGLEVIGVFKPPNIHLPDEKGRRNESPTYSSSVHFAAVEVDVETGEVKVLRYLTVHDSGIVINPAIVEGMVIGCVAQGLGVSLLEEIRYSHSGQPLSSTFMDYLLPSADFVPKIEVVTYETPSSVLGGFRGAGQSGSMATPAAIFNAVEDALADLNIRLVNKLPLTPERLWQAVRKVY